MNLDEGKEMLKRWIEPHKNEEFYVCHRAPCEEDGFGELIIEFPGNRNRYERGLDYRVKLNGICISHRETADVFYDLSVNGNNQINEHMLINFLLDIYRYGTVAEINHLPDFPIHICGMDLDWARFRQLIFYLNIQEDFNFPPPGNRGKKMPFIRYIEAILSANHPDKLSQEGLYERILRGIKDFIFGIPDQYRAAIDEILNT